MLEAYQYAVLFRRVVKVDWEKRQPIQTVMSEHLNSYLYIRVVLKTYNTLLKKALKCVFRYRAGGLSNKCFVI